MSGYPKTLGLLVRMLAVAFLVGATYNPIGNCFVAWLLAGGDPRWTLKLFVGLLLAGGYVFCVRALIRSLNLAGTLPLLLVIASFVWLLASWHVIDLGDPVERTLVIEASIVALLGTGVCFSIIRYHLSGQLDSRSLN